MIKYYEVYNRRGRKLVLEATMNKIKKKYKDICDKYPEFSSITIISLVILFAFVVTLICKTITGTTSDDQVSITTNIAEEKY